MTVIPDFKLFCYKISCKNYEVQLHKIQLHIKGFNLDVKKYLHKETISQ